MCLGKKDIQLNTHPSRIKVKLLIKRWGFLIKFQHDKPVQLYMVCKYV